MEDGGNHRLKKEWKICTALPAVTINPIAFTAKLRLSGQTERYFSIYKRAHGCVAGRRIVQRFVLLATRLLVTCNWKFILAHVHTVAHTATRDARYATIVPGNWLAHSYFRLTPPTHSRLLRASSFNITLTTNFDCNCTFPCTLRIERIREFFRKCENRIILRILWTLKWK